ncbi:hypothetical protein FEM48_Zijuj01G0183400 [Ziziphus jujuba var. spinosa]|uniref:Uncharacterized protein n=1 Tax=Ziziphus jujuba var. spinosa TaxID=714518 RepID=A0A978W2U5_ZIZJJ|nr:hypothetical protein FEM48_Zijuj01G0183400 [Ziziphus jujuba var. spinosa]
MVTIVLMAMISLSSVSCVEVNNNGLAQRLSNAGKLLLVDIMMKGIEGDGNLCPGEVCVHRPMDCAPGCGCLIIPGAQLWLSIGGLCGCPIYLASNFNAAGAASIESETTITKSLSSVSCVEVNNNGLAQRLSNAGKLLLVDIMMKGIEGDGNLFPGEVCVHRPMDCAPGCGCLIIPGVCYGNCCK